MKVPNYNPSFADVYKGCAMISHNLTETPSVIIGLTRGGLVPAVLLSHMMSIPMIPVSYSSMKGRGEFRGYDGRLPSTDIPGKNVLVVDDICDSGHTLSEISRFYHDLHHDVQVAALYYKIGAIIRPDCYWQKIPEDGGWVTFPWEV